MSIQIFRIVLIAGAIAVSAVATPKAAVAQASKESSTTEDVSKWTQKQWNAAKAKWMKEKDKWASCNKQASNQKLTGRKSWSFIYTCMTK